MDMPIKKRVSVVKNSSDLRDVRRDVRPDAWDEYFERVVSELNASAASWSELWLCQFSDVFRVPRKETRTHSIDMSKEHEQWQYKFAHESGRTQAASIKSIRVYITASDIDGYAEGTYALTMRIMGGGSHARFALSYTGVDGNAHTFNLEHVPSALYSKFNTYGGYKLFYPDVVECTPENHAMYGISVDDCIQAIECQAAGFHERMSTIDWDYGFNQQFCGFPTDLDYQSSLKGDDESVKRVAAMVNATTRNDWDEEMDKRTPFASLYDENSEPVRRSTLFDRFKLFSPSALNYLHYAELIDQQLSMRSI